VSEFPEFHGKQRGEEQALNIPIPDPSDKTITVLREAIAQQSQLVDSKMGGIQQVIAEQFKSIDRRLADRDASLALASGAAKETVATALAAVVETGRGGNIRFDLLERRVAALELAISGASGKSSGMSTLTAGIVQTIATAGTIIAGLAAYFALSHK
jgi:hypothetical protein